MAMKRIVRKYRIGSQPKDTLYWRTRPIEERLAALETIRSEFYGRKYRERLRRVYRVIKQK